MEHSRRDFLKAGIVTIAGLSVPLGAFKFLAPEAVADIAKNASGRWVFVVDTTKCIGCGMCVKACQTENELPYNVNLARTWVERYIEKKDGSVIVDSPKQARDGFIRNNPLGLEVSKTDIAKAYFVPQAVQPVRSAALRGSLSCGGHI